MNGLTDRQREVLQTLWQFAKDHGRYPTIREMGDRLGIDSPNGIMIHLMALRKKGYITQSGKGKPHAWGLTGAVVELRLRNSIEGQALSAELDIPVTEGV